MIELTQGPNGRNYMTQALRWVHNYLQIIKVLFIFIYFENYLNILKKFD